MERPPAYVSPGGRFRVEWTEHSFVGSSTFVQPCVLDTSDGAVLLDLTGAGSFGWFAFVTGASGATLELAVRRVMSGSGCTVVIDADARTYEIRDAARGGKGLRHVRERLRFGGLEER